MNTFPCNQCGACCKFIDGIEELSKYNLGNGTCMYLGDDNKCKIYPSRPDVCRGEYIYSKYFKGYNMERFHQEMLKICKDLYLKETNRRLK